MKQQRRRQSTAGHFQISAALIPAIRCRTEIPLAAFGTCWLSLIHISAQFTDVKEGTWYYDYVMQAAAAGIVNGKGNGIFDPEGNVTRRDFALMTARMLNADTSSYTTSPFKDVNDNDYALGAIAYCYDKKIIGGYEAVSYTHLDVYKRQKEDDEADVCCALAAGGGFFKFRPGGRQDRPSGF